MRESIKEGSLELSRGEFLRFSALATLTLVMPESWWGEEEKRDGWVINKFETEKPQMALTFDDGIVPEALEDILDILRDSNQTATFFLTGNYSKYILEKEKPGILARLVEEGHEIGYHTMTHEVEEEMRKRDADWFGRDYDRWNDVHREILGEELFNKGVKVFARAPWAVWTNEFMNMCRINGIKMFGWSRVSDNNPEMLVEKGDILLMHVKSSDVVYIKALTEILMEKGIRGSSLTDMMEEEEKGMFDILIWQQS